jgi:hypothetical protein
MAPAAPAAAPTQLDEGALLDLQLDEIVVAAAAAATATAAAAAAAATAAAAVAAGRKGVAR